MKRDVGLLPPAFVKTVLANSFMKWAEASEAWFGTLGYCLLPVKQKYGYDSRETRQLM